MPVVGGRVPDAGDLIWIDFGPPAGHEQSGRRPALVVSPVSYNRASSLLLVCPVTRNPRPWPFKVVLEGIASFDGFVLVDQVKSIDPALRSIRRTGHASSVTLAAVRAMLVEWITGGAAFDTNG